MTTSLNRQFQQLDVSKNTTPSSNSTARKSKAGDVDRYEQKQIHAELAMDLEKASKCSFDQLLQYFQYLVLKPDSAEKQELDRLQRDIEKLQLQRFYGEKQTRCENTAGDAEEDRKAREAREARQKRALAEEEDLIQKRDAIQNELLRHLLQVTLLISNQTKFKRLLHKLDRGFREGNEVARYKPFVELSNALLDEFEHFHKKSKPAELRKLAKSKKVDLNLPFRKADKLDIRFRVNHPTQIHFRYYGTQEAVKRNPDVIVSSRAALARRSGAKNEPDAPNDWAMNLCSVEFKRRFRNRQTFLGELPKILRHNFELTLVEEHLQDEISKLDSEIDDLEGGQEGNEQLLWGLQLVEDKHEERNTVQEAEQEEDEQAEDVKEGDMEEDVEQEKDEEQEQEQQQEEAEQEEDEEDEGEEGEDGQQQQEGAGQQEDEERQGDDNEEEDYVMTDGSRVPAARSKRTRETADFVADKEQPAAKKIRPLPTPSASGSRSMASVPAHEVQEPDTNQDAVAGRVQCASYALEMLSYSIGVHHAINILFTDGILWVWYYDRQGIIQSTGVSLFKDFPRFIALLFVLQRFSLVDWGIIPELNPEAVREHKAQTSEANVNSIKYPVQVKLQDNSGPRLENYKDFASFWQKRGDKSAVTLSKVRLNTNEFLSHQPHCLSGRATAVVPAIGSPEGSRRKPKAMVCKVYHPEFQRRHEGLTMDVVYAIAQADEQERAAEPKEAKVGDWNMFNHLPKVYFYGDLKGTSTHLVRSMVNCDWKGHRTARMIAMKELQKVTTLEGWDFVKAWLDAVTCHAFLWKSHVEHGDPSLSNVMYDEETKSGVLTDFDLSLLQWEPRVLGTERTGTVPFVAIDLLCDKYWKVGTLIRYYYHELESFIWILPYVFLLFEEGEQLENPLVDPWRTGDYNVCSKEKLHFFKHGLEDAGKSVQKSYAKCWKLALRLCLALRKFQNDLDLLKEEDLTEEDSTEEDSTEEDSSEEDSTEEDSVEGEQAVHAEDPFLVVQSPTSHSSQDEIHAASNEADEEAEIVVRASKILWSKFTETIKRLSKVNDLNFVPLLNRLSYYEPSFEPLTSDEETTLQERYRDILYPLSTTIEAEAPSP